MTTSQLIHQTEALQMMEVGLYRLDAITIANHQCENTKQYS